MAESNGIDAGLAFGKLNIADMPETDMDFFSKVILGNAFHGAEVVDPLAKSFIMTGIITSLSFARTRHTSITLYFCT